MKPGAKFALKMWLSVYVAVAAFAIMGKLLGTATLPLQEAEGRLLDEPVEIEGVDYGVGMPVSPVMIKALAGQGVEEIRTRRPGILGFRHYGSAMTFLNFAGLVLLIYAFAWDKLVAALDKKGDTIKNELAVAESRKKESVELLRTYEALRDKLQAEREAILGEAEADGKTARDELVKSAEETADIIVKAAERETQAREEHSLWELRKAVAARAVDLAEDVLRREVTGKDHEFLVQDFLAKLREMEPA